MLKRILGVTCSSLLLLTLTVGCNSEKASTSAVPEPARTPTDKAATMLLSEPANGKIVKVMAGDSFRVRLWENPTTGYGWTLKISDPKVIKPASNVFVPPNSNLMGAPGYRLAMFQALAPGKSTIEFSYARSWEKGVAPVKTWKVEVQVDK